MHLKILMFIDYFEPGYKGGGPARAVAALVRSLGERVEFTLVTRDRDLGNSVVYGDEEKNKIKKQFPGDIYYLSSHGWSTSIRRLICEFQGDCLFLNSFFSFKSSIMPLLLWRMAGKPMRIGVAPRGEFSEGALRLKKIKKKLFIGLAKLTGLYRNVLWAASTKYEAEDIKSVMGKGVRVSILPEKTVINSNVEIKKIKSDRLRIIFLSRIVPKKNLNGALEILEGVKGDIDFDIYGPIEDLNYWSECDRRISMLPENVKCKYCGTVAPEDVQEVFSNYDLFLFPTLGENYGHVIAEALAVGVPVLISDTTPWRGLEDNELGWDCPLVAKSAFRAAIERSCKIDPGTYMAWRSKIKEWARVNIGGDEWISENWNYMMELTHA